MGVGGSSFGGVSWSEDREGISIEESVLSIWNIRWESFVDYDENMNDD